MSKAPEFVVTGMTVPSVRFWARVLVRPHRLQDVKQSIIWHGRADLRPGELLQIDIDPGDGIERAVTVGDPDAKRPWGHCIVAWNEIAGDVTVYGDDGDHLASITDPVVEALVGRNPHELITKEIWLHSDRIGSIHVGGVHINFVHVHFDRDGADEAKDPTPEDILEQQEAERSFFRSKGLVWPTGEANEKADTPADTLLQAGTKFTLTPDAKAEALDPYKLVAAQVATLKWIRSMERAGLKVGTSA